MEAELILLKKRLKREIKSRKEADKLLEQKSLKLWEANRQLQLSLDEKSLDLQRINEELLNSLQNTSEELHGNLQLLNEYKKAIDYSTMVSMTDKEGVIIYVNDAFVKISGYSKEELIGSPHNIIRHPSSPHGQFKSMWTKLLNKKPWHGVIKNLAKDKRTYYVDTTITPILDQTGVIDKFMAIRQDITSLVEASQKVEDEKNRTTAILNHQESIVILSSKEDEITLINQKFFDIFPFDDLKSFKKEHDCICELFVEREGCLGSTEGYHDWADPIFTFPNELHLVCMTDRMKNEKLFSVQAIKVFLDNGYFFLFSFTDITKVKQMEKELENLNSSLEKRVIEEVEKNKQTTTYMLQQSRLAQMGEMLSMIAHQWRQPLASISAITTTLSLDVMMDSYKKEFFEENLESINKLTQHLSSTINDFRDFFKVKKELEETSLEEIIKDSLQIIGPAFDSNKITVFQESLDPNVVLKTYANELKQVVLNIIKNAEDALLEQKTSNAKIWMRCYKKDSYISLSIEDNGGGIPQMNMIKIFDPYFSTKQEKDGTGLGLYMSKIIIEEHCKGRLSVSNTENGAKFIIELPI